MSAVMSKDTVPSRPSLLSRLIEKFTSKVVDNTGIFRLIDGSTNHIIGKIPMQNDIEEKNPLSMFFHNGAKTVRVIYNPHSIDSCLAVCIIAERVLEANSESKIHTVPVDYISHDTVQGKADLLVNAGVAVDGVALAQEVHACKPDLILSFNYLKQPAPSIQWSSKTPYVTVDPSNIGDYGRDVPTPTDDDLYTTSKTYMGRTIKKLKKEKIFGENSICHLVNEYFYSEFLCGREATVEQKRLMRAAANYINFVKFDSLWFLDQSDKKQVRRRAHNDLAFLYRNMREIRRNAAAGKSHPIPTSGLEDVSNYTDEIARVRDIMRRNRSERRFNTAARFGGGGRGIIANVVAVGEDDSLQVMRQLRHAFAVAITYEDTAEARIWRIMTDDVKTLSVLKDSLQPTRVWTDCQVLYFACDLPKLNENIH